MLNGHEGRATIFDWAPPEARRGPFSKETRPAEWGEVAQRKPSLAKVTSQSRLDATNGEALRKVTDMATYKAIIERVRGTDGFVAQTC